MSNEPKSSDKSILTAKDKKVLHQQTIDENGPGTILRDFEMMLDFIDPEGVTVTGNQKLLPLRTLAPLNLKLSRPVELDLKRPQLKSYPPLNGLYLLVRASGLTLLDSRGAKPKLRVDEAVLGSWTGLNPTEKYLTLLESWLLRGSPAIVGERDFWSWRTHHLGSWSELLERIPQEGLTVASREDLGWYLRYRPGLHNLALGELFGLISLEPAPPVPGEGWQLARLARTPLGDAIYHLLFDFFIGDFENMVKYNADDDFPCGELQPLFQPYFPEWQQNLIIPEAEFQAGLHIFKVSLGRIWRRIAIPAQLTLDALSSAILNAYRFDFDHLYYFSYSNRFGAKVKLYHSYMEEGPWATDVAVGDMPLQPGQSMTYLYDFGDNWQFNVTLERIDPPSPKIKKPTLLESHGKAPQQYGPW